MIVNKNSWHYRFNVWRTNEWKTERKKTLCSYFWFTVFNIVLVSLMVVGIIGLLSLIGGSANGELIKHGYDVLFPVLYPLLGVLVVAAAICFGVAVVGVIWAIVAGYQWGVQKYKINRRVSEPGLMISFIKAKKSKICPIIEFKD